MNNVLMAVIPYRSVKQIQLDYKKHFKLSQVVDEGLTLLERSKADCGPSANTLRITDGPCPMARFLPRSFAMQLGTTLIQLYCCRVLDDLASFE